MCGGIGRIQLHGQQDPVRSRPHNQSVETDGQLPESCSPPKLASSTSRCSTWYTRSLSNMYQGASAQEEVRKQRQRGVSAARSAFEQCRSGLPRTFPFVAQGARSCSSCRRRCCLCARAHCAARTEEGRRHSCGARASREELSGSIRPHTQNGQLHQRIVPLCARCEIRREIQLRRELKAAFDCAAGKMR